MEENQIVDLINNYFPIKIDFNRNPTKFADTIEPDI
jgi:hypothetical protein